MTRLLCTGDTHLGKSAQLYPGRLADMERVWRETLEAARDRECDAVLHAGDLFDSRRPGPDVIVAAERPLVEHRALGGCPVHVIAGNHDIPNLSGECGLDVLSEAGLIVAHREPATMMVDDVGVAFLPWAPVSRLVAELDIADRGEVYELAGGMLVRAADDLRVELDDRARVFVLVAHWSVTGAQLPSGLPIEHVREVIVDRATLEAQGWAAIVLAHIHRPGNVAGSPFSFYTGSPMVLDHGEANVEHGALVYDVAADTLERVAFDAPAFVTISLPDSDYPADDLDVSSYAGSVVRVRDTVDAAAVIDYAAIRARLLDAGALRVDTQITVEREARADREAADLDVEPAALLQTWLEQTGTKAGDVGRLVELGRGYLEGPA